METKSKRESLENGEFYKGMRITKDMKLNRKPRPKFTKKNEVFKTTDKRKMPPVTKMMKKQKGNGERIYQYHQSLTHEGLNQDLFRFRS